MMPIGESQKLKIPGSREFNSKIANFREFDFGKIGRKPVHSVPIFVPLSNTAQNEQLTSFEAIKEVDSSVI